MNTRRITAALIVAVILCLPASAQEETRKPFEPARDPVRVQGVVSVVWGDPLPGRSDVPARKFVLNTDHGANLELALDDRVVASAGGARKINGRRVEIMLSSGVGEDLQLTSAAECGGSLPSRRERPPNQGDDQPVRRGGHRNPEMDLDPLQVLGCELRAQKPLVLSRNVLVELPGSRLLLARNFLQQGQRCGKRGGGLGYDAAPGKPLLFLERWRHRCHARRLHRGCRFNGVLSGLCRNQHDVQR